MKIWIILDVTKPSHRWHQCQRVELRSVESRQKWPMQQCQGEFIKYCQATVEVVQKTDGSYGRMGVQLFVFDHTSTDADGAGCAPQDALSGHIGDMAPGAAGSRLN